MEISEGYSTTAKLPKSRRKKKKKLNKIGRISGLPDAIICHILSFLPTNSSVATSILARRWRFLWAEVPNFDLVGRDKDHDGINKVMSLHKLPDINTFRLIYMDEDSLYKNFRKDISSYDKRCHEIEGWLVTAAARNVKKLDLELLNEITYEYVVFNCKTVVDLRLRKAQFFPVDFPSYLPCLKKLHLHLYRPDRNFSSEECLPRLLSSCPVLEELIFERVVDNFVDPDYLEEYEHAEEHETFCCYVSSPIMKRLTLNSQYDMCGDYVPGSYRVEINAPALRYLKVEDWISEDISVGELNHLIEANICLDNLEVQEDEALYTRSMLEFVGRLCNVKHLKLSCIYLKARHCLLGLLSFIT